MQGDKVVSQIAEGLGGISNIISVANCMTRLRVVVKNDDVVDEEKLKDINEVLIVIHDRKSFFEIVVGPGKSRKYADIFKEMKKASGDESEACFSDEKESCKRKGNKVKDALKIFGDIFAPLIPGVIAAGLCAGFASLITQLVPNYADIPVWNVVYIILNLVNTSFMTYITAWTGYRAAERFGATPILGGMLGLITSLDGINALAQTLGLYNESDPLQSVLRVGKGGILAVFLGVIILAFVEKKIRKIMPDSMDVVFTPFLTMLIVIIPYTLLIMPLFGLVSSGIVWIFGNLCMSSSIIVRLITGYVAAAIFLPLVAMGMHHGLIALYSTQLQALGFVTLYPAFAMAGAGQVGAALAILIKSKRIGNKKMTSVIRGALPAGILGVGEPLVYGVTLPLGKPFLTAGLGAGFGGAFVMLMQVASTTWGPSGVLGVFVMTAGQTGPISSIIFYAIGLAISYVMGFVITNFVIKDAELMPEKTDADAAKQSMDADALQQGLIVAKQSEDAKATQQGLENVVMMQDSICDKDMAASLDLSKYASVKAGETISFDCDLENSFEFCITDPLGIHVRPAGDLAEVLKRYDCTFTIEANGNVADGKSVMQLMDLDAKKGTTLNCKVEGPDSEKGSLALKNYLENNL